MKCNHCGKDLAAKLTDQAYRKRWEARADRAVEELAAIGLKEWLQKRGCSEYRCAQLLGCNTSTVQSWGQRGRIPPVSLAALRGLVFEGKI